MNSTWIGFISGVVLVFEVEAATLLVDENNANPQHPYASWETAATNIQTAVDAASAGDRVLVANGRYASGGRAVYGVATNRVIINKAIVVQSMNGPEYTSIIGGGVSNGNGAVRCVWLGANATLSGFTLSNGHTQVEGSYLKEKSGGGVWCEGASSTISNCVVSSCSASKIGGGMYLGRANNTIFVGNSAGGGGGGMYQGLANNCVFFKNSASYGGGMAGGTLNNCTLLGNTALNGGGAIGGAWWGETCHLNNSILWNNTALIGSNWMGDKSNDIEMNHCCTHPLPTDGVGNIDQPPKLATTSHLSESSPCIGAGNALYSTGVDIDGEAWNGVPSMGCDEVRAGSVTGDMTAEVSAPFTNIACGFPVEFTGSVKGRSTGSQWDFSDGTAVSNEPLVSHSWSSPGVYEVVLSVFNETHPKGIDAHIFVKVENKPIHYVDLTTSSPTAPYTSWATAATNIQDAINATTLPGALVLVSDGLYNQGGQRADATLTNRVVINKPITVQSLNGPQATTISGEGPTNGISAIRCVWLDKGATLSGFTLTNGHTHDTWAEGSGGALLGQGFSSTASNCVMAGNSAYFRGGAATQVAAISCELTQNHTDHYGGGAGLCLLNRCTLKDNVAAIFGGGADFCELNHCALSGNFSEKTGGGTSSSTINNCSIVRNSAGETLGGVYRGQINNSIVWNNTAPENANWAEDSLLNNSCTTPLPTNGVGNIETDPQFTSSNDFHLADSSPCIDAGNNTQTTGTKDLNESARILDGDANGTAIVDMGCYEFLNKSADSDGDCIKDGDESIAGTNPSNPDDYFQILRTSYSSTSGITLFFNSLDNRQYQLFWRSNLVDDIWHPATATPRMGTGGMDSFSDTTPEAAPRFYRVEVSLP